jgi:6-phosphogluconolactonase
MQQPPIDPYESAEQMYAAAANRFCEVVSTRAAGGIPVRISLSGGSTPRRLYQILAGRDLPWSQIHWFWGDERNVDPSHEESNFRMVREALLDPIGAPQANVHAVPVNIGDPQSAALRYQQTLHDHFPGDSFPLWDLVLLGMGDDAHTASLFPGTAAVDDCESWFVANWVEKFDSYRYTLTASAINSARECWFLVSGPGKREAMTRVLSDHREPRLYPSQLITPTRWFVTQDAFP